MPGYDGAGSLFALGMRLTKLNADGTPMTGANNCYTTEAMATIGINQEYSDPDVIEFNNGQGIACVYYAPPKTLLRGLIEDFVICNPDPNVLQFCCGGEVITTGGVNEVQSLTISGSPTGGTYTLTYNGQTTAPIAYNANAAAIQSALIALNNLSTGDVVVTGSGPYTITFGGALSNVNVTQIVGNGAGLTGGSTPAATVTTTTQGAAGSNVIGYRAPVVNTEAIPNGVAVEAWSRAVLNNSFAASLPFFHWVLGRCKLNPSEAISLGAEDPTTPTFEGQIEQNPNFGAGPEGDIVFPTDRLYQYSRVATKPDLTRGFVTVA